MTKPRITGANSGVTSQLNLDADGRVESVTETLPGHLAESIAQQARTAADRHRPVVGNTQDHFRHIAEIPPIFVNDLMRRGIWGDTKRVKQWLREECPRDFIVGPINYLK